MKLKLQWTNKFLDGENATDHHCQKMLSLVTMLPRIYFEVRPACCQDHANNVDKASRNIYHVASVLVMQMQLETKIMW